MKILFTLFFIFIIMFCLVACNVADDIDDKATEKYAENTGFVIIKKLGECGDTCTYLVYDAETKVEYILIDGYCETSLCPYFDENGDVVIYKGE